MNGTKVGIYSSAQLAANELQELLGRYLGAPLTSNEVERLERDVNELGVKWRNQGVDFAQLRVLALPGRGFVMVVRADAEHEQIQRYVQAMQRARPQATAIELAHAIRRVFPDYRGIKELN